jgi:hypothetical protein
MKTQNYTAEMTRELVEGYSAQETAEARETFLNLMAAKFEKTVPSVRAKLVREKVYVPAEKSKGKAVRKDELVASIARLTDSDEELMESLSKATREALTIVRDALKS